MLDTIKLAKDKVYHILEISEATRDNDVMLYCVYLNKYHNLSEEIGQLNYKKLKQIMRNAPVPESITRARRKIQEGGEFVGKRKIRRMELEEEVRMGIKDV